MLAATIDQSHCAPNPHRAPQFGAYHRTGIGSRCTLVPPQGKDHPADSVGQTEYNDAMTQQPFSRPGAIDLSGMAAPAAPGGASCRFGSRSLGGSAYSQDVDEAGFQGGSGSIDEGTGSAGLLLADADARERATRAGHRDTLRQNSRGGSWRASSTWTSPPGSRPPCRFRSIPLVVVVLDGRPMPLLQDVVPLDELRTALTQILQQFTAQGITGRHQPRGSCAGRGRGRRVRRSSVRRRPGGPWAKVTSTARSRSTRSWWMRTRPMSKPRPDWPWRRC